MNHGNTNQHFADYRGAPRYRRLFREERAAFCGESQVVGASSAVGRPLDELPIWAAERSILRPRKDCRSVAEHRDIVPTHARGRRCGVLAMADCSAVVLLPLLAATAASRGGAPVEDDPRTGESSSIEARCRPAERA